MRDKIKHLALLIWDSRWRIVAIAGIFFLPIFLWGIIQIRSLYVTNAHFINEQIDAQALSFPAGIYAAPRHLIIGQQLTYTEIADRLLRAGYEQGTQTNDFAVGSFSLLNNIIEIQTRNFATTDNLPSDVHVELKQNAVVRITDAKSKAALKEITLPAEMLSADFESRRQTRRPISMDELPPALRHALLTAEDQRFFDHRGIDLKGIFRAFVHNLRTGKIGQGASTLTQQLVKNHFLTPERTYTRKINEIMMAIALERRLTKQQILSLYCDRVYLGHSGITSVYGFKQGARVYLGKELKDLSAAESALLVGLIKAPNRYSPHLNSEGARMRRNQVLHAMAEAGYLSQTECIAAKNEQLDVLAPQVPDAISAPYFVDYVRREMNRFESREHLQVRVDTTLDLDLQQAANETVQKHLTCLGKLLSKGRNAPPEAALIALNPKTGEIFAMTGGRDYTTSQLNRVTDAHRQPGSVFKPIVYAAALSQGILPSTAFMNAPQEFQNGQYASYRPQNYGRSYTYQPVLLRDALVRSLNVVTVEAALQTGLSNVARMAEKMGLPRPVSYPSMALGAFETTPLEIASAYTTFANRGMHVEPNAIRSIRRQGVVEAEPSPVKAGVLSSTTAYLVTDALMDVVNRGTAARVRQMGYRGPVAGKTGTSRDAWFVGYTPNLLVVVWVGRDDNEDLRMTGGEAAVPIWTDFIKRIAQLRPDLVGGKFEAPAGMEMMKLCATSGGLANEYCAEQRGMLVSQSMIPPPCNEHLPPLQPSEDEAINVLFSDGQSLAEPVPLPPAVTPIKAQLPDAARAELERLNWTIPDK